MASDVKPGWYAATTEDGLYIGCIYACANDDLTVLHCKLTSIADLLRDAELMCAWSYDGDGTWETSCSQAFTIIDGTPSDNEMKFCCYCGGKLIERQP